MYCENGLCWSLIRCRNTGLYVSSRTLFSLAQKYGSNYIKKTVGLGTTNAGHTPIPAIICCSILGCVTFLCLTDQTYDLVSYNPVCLSQRENGLQNNFS